MIYPSDFLGIQPNPPITINISVLINPFLSNDDKIVMGNVSRETCDCDMANNQLMYLAGLKNTEDVEYCLKQLKDAKYINIYYDDNKRFIKDLSDYNMYYSKIAAYYSDMLENCFNLNTDEFYNLIRDLFYESMIKECPHFNFPKK
jgi:hypothetical protein